MDRIMIEDQKPVWIPCLCGGWLCLSCSVHPADCSCPPVHEQAEDAYWVPDSWTWLDGGIWFCRDHQQPAGSCGCPSALELYRQETGR